MLNFGGVRLQIVVFRLSCCFRGCTSKFTQMRSSIFHRLRRGVVFRLPREPCTDAPRGSMGLEYFSCMDTAYVRETPPPKQPNHRYLVPLFWVPWNFWWTIFAVKYMVSIIFHLENRGRSPIWRAYFSAGLVLQPPTRTSIFFRWVGSTTN